MSHPGITGGWFGSAGAYERTPMNKYATPQTVVHEDGEQVVSATPLKPCCKETTSQMRKQAGTGHVHTASCGCGNKIEVSKD